MWMKIVAAEQVVQRKSLSSDYSVLEYVNFVVTTLLKC